MEQVTADHVHDFEDGGREQVDLLGGKGANLAEMTRLGRSTSGFHDRHRGVSPVPEVR